MAAGAIPPVEPGDAPRQRPNGWQPADFRGPGEEVRLHYSLETGGVPERPAMQQVGGVAGRYLTDVDSEGRLHRHADDHAQVGVPDEQVVQLLRGGGNLAQGRPQQVEPQLPFYFDGLVVGVFLEKHPQGGDIPLIPGAVGAQVLFDVAPVRWNAFQRYQGLVAQPLEKREPALGVL